MLCAVFAAPLWGPNAIDPCFVRAVLTLHEGLFVACLMCFTGNYLFIKLAIYLFTYLSYPGCIDINLCLQGSGKMLLFVFFLSFCFCFFVTALTLVWVIANQLFITRRLMRSLISKQSKRTKGFINCPKINSNTSFLVVEGGKKEDLRKGGRGCKQKGKRKMQRVLCGEGLNLNCETG